MTTGFWARLFWVAIGQKDKNSEEIEETEEFHCESCKDQQRLSGKAFASFNANPADILVDNFLSLKLL